MSHREYIEKAHGGWRSTLVESHRQRRIRAKLRTMRRRDRDWFARKMLDGMLGAFAGVMHLEPVSLNAEMLSSAATQLLAQPWPEPEPLLVWPRERRMVRNTDVAVFVRPDDVTLHEFKRFGPDGEVTHTLLHKVAPGDTHEVGAVVEAGGMTFRKTGEDTWIAYGMEGAPYRWRHVKLALDTAGEE